MTPQQQYGRDALTTVVEAHQQWRESHPHPSRICEVVLDHINAGLPSPSAAKAINGYFQAHFNHMRISGQRKKNNHYSLNDQISCNTDYEGTVGRFLAEVAAPVLELTWAPHIFGSYADMFSYFKTGGNATVVDLRMTIMHTGVADPHLCQFLGQVGMAFPRLRHLQVRIGEALCRCSIHLTASGVSAAIDALIQSLRMVPVKTLRIDVPCDFIRRHEWMKAFFGNTDKRNRNGSSRLNKYVETLCCIHLPVVFASRRTSFLQRIWKGAADTGCRLECDGDL